MTIASEDTLVWAAFHTLQQSATKSPLCVLQPYFYKTFTTPVMVKYGLGIQRQANEWLNPSGNGPDVYGESVLIVVHI